MLFAALTRSSSGNLYSLKRLREAAAARGHRLVTVNPQHCYMGFERNKPILVLPDGIPLKKISAVFPRLGASITEYGVAVVNQFDLMGIPVLNQAPALGRARDTLRSIQRLARFNVDIPRTVMARRPHQIAEAIRYVGGPPVVLKLLQGTQGVGVILADSFQSVQATLDALWSLGQDILIQEFISESKGTDVRALVMDGKVVAAMRRRARFGEFRSNFHRGGTGEPVRLPPEYEEAAVRSAEVIGLQIAGVDMLEAKTGPKVLEVNASPGFEGLERAARMDVAAQFIACAERAVEERKR
jgi:ribosomal protein S6--L-glutamate ligase